MTINIPKINYDDIPGRVVYEVIAGSHSQNCATRSSDVDIKGVFIASEIDLYTGTSKKSYRSNDNTIHYELTHFLRLLEKGDFNAIEMLFIKEGFITVCDDIFKNSIIKNKHMFITKKVFKNIEKLLHSNFNNLIKESADIDYTKDNKKWVKDKENPNIYYNAKGISHCMRILITYIEYFNTSEINIFRENDKNYLLSIKKGHLIIEHILDELENKTKILTKLFKERSFILTDCINDLYVNYLITDIRKKFYARELFTKKLNNTPHKVY